MKIPPWGLYMMLIASAVGTYLLLEQLHSMGWPRPL